MTSRFTGRCATPEPHSMELLTRFGESSGCGGSEGECLPTFELHVQFALPFFELRFVPFPLRTVLL